jgi:hypothetical protein
MSSLFANPAKPPGKVSVAEAHINYVDFLEFRGRFKRIEFVV